MNKALWGTFRWISRRSSLFSYTDCRNQVVRYRVTHVNMSILGPELWILLRFWLYFLRFVIVFLGPENVHTHIQFKQIWVLRLQCDFRQWFLTVLCLRAAWSFLQKLFLSYLVCSVTQGNSLLIHMMWLWTSVWEVGSILLPELAGANICKPVKCGRRLLLCCCKL